MLNFVSPRRTHFSCFSISGVEFPKQPLSDSKYTVKHELGIQKSSSSKSISTFIYLLATPRIHHSILNVDKYLLATLKIYHSILNVDKYYS